ncbi:MULTISPECIES: BglG family transcription antiterminator [unclassified Cytobacillus]|jgi:activator of the mannose operon, transcriptional antiterminator|uniref:BglG family transcription antiterminator n=1 Tax=unclassified Cytobacillus TaxID=2675268 RepID=UPI00204242D5|nr:BglG family transcription antiterminator [Cytobacillus sp. AMY 15.2]MCM3090743.1 BglG family transcription antiterminator [Cytobacillus sp. AMY 15.2]
MNNRQRELLKILLLHEEGALQIKDLAEDLDCSEKTVRNDLDRLEEFLEESRVSLRRKPGIGISIEIDESERKEMLRSLFSNEQKTAEERLFEMAFQLLASTKAITLQYWADRYYVPKTTIKKDIDTITYWLQRFDLEVVSKQRIGSLIEGPELKKRNAMAHLSELIPTLSNRKNIVLDLFFSYEIAIVKEALKSLQEKYSIGFTAEALDSLLVHALIMVKRIRQKSPVFVQASERATALNRKEYQYAIWFFKQLEEAFGLRFPEAERIYFTWHLISGKRAEESEQILQYDQESKEVVRQLVRMMGNLTLFPFEEDPILQNGLAVHMHSVISRIKYGFPITNPLLANIKKMYPYMFSMVILALEEMKDSIGLEIPEDEAAYIVLHFQASIERMEGNRKVEKKKALIVCHMGIGMSHLLEAKIQQQYQDIEIVACIGKREITDALKEHKADFIISTVPLEEEDIEYIQISPLFGQEDKNKLSRFVERLKRKVSQQQKQINFSAFIVPELIFFNVKKEHRYQVVEMLAMALYDKDYVRKEFIHSAVNRERNSATTIGGGIAIPHGDPAMIYKTALAIGIMKEPIEWGNEQVSLVFMLAISKENQGEIRNIIGGIAAISESPHLVYELIAAENGKDFFRLLEEME